MAPGQNPKLELHIHGMTGSGQGVGRTADGLTVFVPGALPDEEVTVSLCRRKKHYGEGKLIKVNLPSKFRINPSCSFGEICGGCVFQHAEYQAELAWKQESVEQTLRRIGGISAVVEPIDPPASPLHYRNRVVWHTDAQGKLGLFPEKSHQLIEVSCLLLEEPLLKATAVLRGLLPEYSGHLGTLRHIALRSNDLGELMLTFISEQPIPCLDFLSKDILAQLPNLVSLWENLGAPVYSVYGGQWRQLRGRYFLDRLAGQTLEIAPAAFLQVNRKEAERLYGYAAEFADLRGGETLWDLYAGGGSIGLALGAKAKHIAAVESYAPAVSAGKRNAERNGRLDMDFFCGKTEEILPRLVKEGGRAQVAVLDPPRAGCEKAALDALIQAGPQKIVYVSCNPATLARDLRILSQGGYGLNRVKPVDLFPRTGHVETVVLLSKLKTKKHVNIEFADELDLTSSESKAT